MFGEFPGKEEPDSGLDLARGDGGLLVVLGQTGGLSSDPLEQVVDEGIHDGHGLGGHASVGVDLLEHFVDEDGVRLLPLRLPLFLIACGFWDQWLGGSLASLSRFSGSFGKWHRVQS